MNLASCIRRLASKLLPHHGNKKLTSPPATIPVGPGKPILVKSKMRSGTHLLIDLILNNFPQYRQESLYVELDHAYHLGLRESLFENLGTCLCKTHFAGLESELVRKKIVEAVAPQAFIIEPVRDSQAIEQSLRKFILEPDELNTALEEARLFDDYWLKHDSLKVSFKDLVTKEGNNRIIEEVARYTGESPILKPVYNRRKSEDANKVLFDKLFTRLFGKKIKRVNTTIQFNS